MTYAVTAAKLKVWSLELCLFYNVLYARSVWNVDHRRSHNYASPTSVSGVPHMVQQSWDDPEAKQEWIADCRTGRVLVTSWNQMNCMSTRSAERSSHEITIHQCTWACQSQIEMIEHLPSSPQTSGLPLPHPVPSPSTCDSDINLSNKKCLAIARLPSVNWKPQRGHIASRSTIWQFVAEASSSKA